MQRFRFSSSALLLALLGLSFLAGCTRPPDEDIDDPLAGGVKPVKAEPMKPMEYTEKGTLSGKVTLSGDLPDLAALDSETEKMIKDSKNGKGCTAYKQQKWVVGGGLGNVVVMLRPEKNRFFPLTTADLQGLKPEVTIDQPGCAFTDHVVVVFPQYPDPKKPTSALPTGQKLVILNSVGGVPHSFHFDSTPKNPGMDRSTQPNTRLPVDLVPDSSPILATCGVHPWMACCIWAVDNPYYAVTDSDGRFTIKNVPACKCRIVFWHEVLGYGSKDGFKGEPIELKPGANVKDFTFTFTRK